MEASVLMSRPRAAISLMGAVNLSTAVAVPPFILMRKTSAERFMDISRKPVPFLALPPAEM